LPGQRNKNDRNPEFPLARFFISPRQDGTARLEDLTELAG
jgi:hypothetical protein